MNAVTQTTQKGQVATPEFIWNDAITKGMHFPQVIDKTRSLYKYANSSSISLPFHVGIDLRSMKIVHARGGSKNRDAIQQIAIQALDN